MTPTALNPLTVPKELQWLYVDFNSYFASVEQQLDPRLRGKPVAVIPVETETTSAIAASYEAKAYGVKTGTPVWEARKMCPGLICVLGRHDHYVEFHERIIDEIDRHIPVTKVCSIDEMACKLMKKEMSVERTAEIAKSIKAGLAKNIGEYVDEETERNSVGHSHVLSPEMRPPAKAYTIAKRLTTKAAARLRRMNYYAGKFSVSFRIENGPRLGLEARCEPSQDSFTFIELLDNIWDVLVRESKGARIKKVNVVLYGLVEAKQLHIQPDLFDVLKPQKESKQRIRDEKISAAMDKLNQKFGKDTVLLGMTAEQGKSFTGTKIAFTRIPDMEEFLE